MTHRRPSRPLACALGALLLAGCGSQAPVQLDVAPAATNDAPVAEPPVTSQVTVSPGRTDRTEQPEVTETETLAPVVEASEPAPAPTTTPSAPSAPVAPLPADPELVIDEDGCATDVATGIVVACHDPAAGPDDD